jgi:hypothetical protein
MRKLLPALLLMLAFSTSHAQTADEIIDKYLAAIGGKQKWLSLNTIIQEGVLKSGGVDIPIKYFQTHNKGSRQELNVAGLVGYDICTPKEGWVFMPFNGQQKPETKSPDDIKRSLDDLDLQGNLIDYKAKGHTVEFIGNEEVEGTDCYKIKLTRKNSGTQTLFIDPASFLVVRQVNKTNVSGQEIESTVDFSDYRSIDGLMFPFYYQFSNDIIQLATVIVNPVIDENIYKPSK